MPQIHIIAWEWREQLDVDELDKHVYHLSGVGRPVRIKAIDTGNDQFAIAIADAELSDEQAYEAYLRHLHEDR